MNEVETEGEFDDVWKELMSYTNPKSNSRFINMYNLRHRWASIFTRDFFTVGLLAISRSECTNRMVKSVQKCSMTLYDFVRNYEEMKKKWRTRENEEDTLGIWMSGQLVSKNVLFSQAASRYTRKIYKKFEAEVTRTFNVILPHDTRNLGDGNLEFSASTGSKGCSRTIIFNTKMYYSSCTCRKWESDGLLCRHILKVYYFMNHFSIPESQILKRWTKVVKEGCFLEKLGTKIHSTLPYMLFLHTAMRHLYEMACCCVDNEDGHMMIIERLESLRRDFFNIVGYPEMKQKCKALGDVNSTDGNGHFFTDPKVVKEKGYFAARECRASQAKKDKDTGTDKTNKRKQTESCSLPPCGPVELMEQLQTSTSSYPPHTAGYLFEGERVMPSSEP